MGELSAVLPSAEHRLSATRHEPETIAFVEHLAKVSVKDAKTIDAESKARILATMDAMPFDVDVCVHVAVIQQYVQHLAKADDLAQVLMAYPRHLDKLVLPSITELPKELGQCLKLHT